MRKKAIMCAGILAALLPLVGAGSARAQAVPTPESVLGHKPRDYFRKLAASSDRIRLISIGRTTRGAAWEIALISSPQNLARLDRYKDISGQLALGRGLTDQQA